MAFSFGIDKVLRLFRAKPTKAAMDHHMAALEALADGDHPRAIAELQMAIRENQGGVDSYLRLGDLYRAEGRLKQAIHLHRSLALMRDLRPELKRRVQWSIAEDFLAAARWNDAQSSLELLLRDKVRDPVLHRRLSQVHLRRGQHERSLGELRKAHKLEGKEAPEEESILLAEAARIKIGEQGWKEARKLLDEALKTHPTCIPALRLSADLYQQEGKDQKAADEIQKLALTGEDGTELTYPQIEKLFFDMGRFHEIQFVYQEVVAARPAFWPARFALAAILEKRGNRVEAVRLLAHGPLATDEVAGRAAGQLLAWEAYDEAAQWLQRWKGTDLPAAFKCSDCGAERTSMRWYCPACHGFKTYEKTPLADTSS